MKLEARVNEIRMKYMKVKPKPWTSNSEAQVYDSRSSGKLRYIEVYGSEAQALYINLKGEQSTAPEPRNVDLQKTRGERVIPVYPNNYIDIIRSPIESPYILFIIII